MKLVRLIKVCLYERNGKFLIGTDLSFNIPVQNGLKQQDTLTPLPFNFALDMPLGGSGKPGGTEIKWDTSAAGLC
jgi:hypothetical protein